MSRTIMTAAELAALPDGRYFDGTYEWDKEGDDWTPLRAPSGMPTQPMSVEARVTTLREPLHDPSTLAPASSVVPEAAIEALREWGVDESDEWGVDESDVTALREAAVEAVAQCPWADCPHGERCVHAKEPDDRDRLPVKPDREAVRRAQHRALVPQVMSIFAAVGGTQADYDALLDTLADAVLDLWPGESRAAVQAEALRDAADEWHAEHYGTRPVAYRWLWDRADRLDPKEK